MTPSATYSRSLRFSRLDWNRKFSVRKAIIGFSMLVLCLFAMRAGHDRFNLPVVYIVFCLDILGLLCIRHAGDLEYGVELLPFLGTMLLGILIQSGFAGGYYVAKDAFSFFVLLFAMVVCVLLLCQKGYGSVIWKFISAVSLFAACCIIIQMVLKVVGIRLDQMGTISDLSFNAWQFSDSFRPCGPFKEPAMFAQMALMGLFYCLFIRRSWVKAGILCLALLLSTSALGLVGMVMLVGAFILNLDKLCGVSRRVKYGVVIGSIFGFALVFALLAWMDSYGLQRVLEGTSLGVRFLRSVDLYALMTPLEKVAGIGLQNQQRYLNYYGIILAHDTYETISTNREYASVLGYVPCATGLLGLVTFMFPFYRVFVHNGMRSKIMTVLFLYTCLFCCIMQHCIFVIYIMAIFATVDMERAIDNK